MSPSSSSVFDYYLLCKEIFSDKRITYKKEEFINRYSFQMFFEIEIFP